MPAKHRMRRRIQLRDTSPHSIYFIKIRLCFRCRNDRNISLVFSSYFETYCSINQGKQRMVFAHTHVLTRIELRSSLTNNDVAGFASLTTKYLNA